MTHVLLIAGPDGSGKSTVADAIEQAAREQGLPVRRVHHRPNLVGRRHQEPITDPHGQQARTVPAGLAKIAVVWLDWAASFCLTVLRRDPCLTIVERGWWDMAVDPQRYRLQPRLAPVVALAGRLLPRARLGRVSQS